jgi:hypothetical protein
MGVVLGAGALTRLLSHVPRRSAFLLLTEIFAASNLGNLNALMGSRNRALIRDLCFAAGAWGAQHDKAQKQNTEANHRYLPCLLIAASSAVRQSLLAHQRTFAACTDAIKIESRSELIKPSTLIIDLA